jgi:hypothetical protein
LFILLADRIGHGAFAPIPSSEPYVTVSRHTAQAFQKNALVGQPDSSPLFMCLPVSFVWQLTNCLRNTHLESSHFSSGFLLRNGSALRTVYGSPGNSFRNGWMHRLCFTGRHLLSQPASAGFSSTSVDPLRGRFSCDSPRGIVLALHWRC